MSCVRIYHRISGPLAALLHGVLNLSRFAFNHLVLGKFPEQSIPGLGFKSAGTCDLLVRCSIQRHGVAGGVAVSIKCERDLCSLRRSGGSVCILPCLLNQDLNGRFGVGNCSNIALCQSSCIIRICIGEGGPLHRLCEFVLYLYCFACVVHIILGQILESGVPCSAFKGSDGVGLQRIVRCAVKLHTVGVAAACQGEGDLCAFRRFFAAVCGLPLLLCVDIDGFHQTHVFVSDHVGAGLDVISHRHGDVQVAIVHVALFICSRKDGIAVVHLTGSVSLKGRHVEVAQDCLAVHEDRHVFSCSKICKFIFTIRTGGCHALLASQVDGGSDAGHGAAASLGNGCGSR